MTSDGFNWDKDYPDSKGRGSYQSRPISFYAQDPNLIGWIDELPNDIGHSRSAKINKLLEFLMETDKMIGSNSKYGDDRSIFYLLKKAVRDTYTE